MRNFSILNVGIIRCRSILVKNMRKIVQIGITITAFIIAWCVVTPRSNAVPAQLDNSDVNKIENLQNGYNLYNNNAEYSNNFVYRYEYNLYLKNWSLDSKIKGEGSRPRMSCLKPDGNRCITPDAIPRIPILHEDEGKIP